MVGNDWTPKIEVQPDHRTSLSMVRPDAGPDRTGSSGRTYRRTVTGPITEPRPDPKPDRLPIAISQKPFIRFT